MRDEIKQQLIKHEGLKLHPYVDVKGKITIGVGRNLTNNGISLEECYILLDNDIDRVIAELSTNLPYFLALDEIRQRVLIDMNFNLGLTSFLKFKNTLELVKEGHYTSASQNMLQSNWAEQVGDRAIRLSRMMNTGRDYK